MLTSVFQRVNRNSRSKCGEVIIKELVFPPSLCYKSQSACLFYDRAIIVNSAVLQWPRPPEMRRSRKKRI